MRLLYILISNSSSEYAYWIYVVIYCKNISKWTAEIHFSDTTIDKLNWVLCYLQANRWWKEDRHCLLLLLLISSKKDCQFSGWLKTSNTALEFVPHYYLVEYQNKCCLTLKVQKWFGGTTLQGLQIIKTACYPVCYLVYSWRLLPPFPVMYHLSLICNKMISLFTCLIWSSCHIGWKYSREATLAYMFFLVSQTDLPL